jgi:hypothetical protein
MRFCTDFKANHDSCSNSYEIGCSEFFERDDDTPTAGEKSNEPRRIKENGADFFVEPAISFMPLYAFPLPS